MPSNTFFHLKSEKQEKLINAARNEFIRKKFSQASINQIIKEAGISRGSFYMYFKDKEDIYLYILEQYRNRFFERFKAILKENQGNLLTSIIELFDFLSSYLFQKENQDFFRNVFINMDLMTEKTLLLSPRGTSSSKDIEQIVDLINFEVLDLKKDELIILMHIIIVMLMQAFISIFVFQMEVCDIRRQFVRQLEFLKNGIYKKSYKKGLKLC